MLKTCYSTLGRGAKDKEIKSTEDSGIEVMAPARFSNIMEEDANRLGGKQLIDKVKVKTQQGGMLKKLFLLRLLRLLQRLVLLDFEPKPCIIIRAVRRGGRVVEGD